MPSQRPATPDVGATAAPDAPTPPSEKLIWCEEFDRILIENRGRMSSALIAELIGHGCTRNAVIGRARRLGLEKLSRHDPTRSVRAHGFVFEPHSSKVPDAAPVIDAQIPFEQRKTLLTLGPRDCRWPVGDPQDDDFFFCGAAKFGTESYCAAHYHRGHSYTAPPGEHNPPVGNSQRVAVRVFGHGAAPADRRRRDRAA